MSGRNPERSIFDTDVFQEESFKDPIPQTPKQNLESKIESLIRSIENLSAKKSRLDLQIKLSKKALSRKREELKRVSSSVRGKTRFTTQSSVQDEMTESKKDRIRTQKLLSESARILED